MSERCWFFTKFVVDLCNLFPGDILDADLHGFKGRLEKYLEKMAFCTFKQAGHRRLRRNVIYIIVQF